jgi:O-antigen/teichoic acid export membrane protein
MSASFYSRVVKSYFWTLFAYVIRFARQFILVPLFLKYIGEKQYSFWFIVIAAIGIVMTLNHGYFQYVSNKVNLDFRIDKNKAIRDFRSAFRFSIVQLIVLLFIILILSTKYIFPLLSKIDFKDVVEYKLNFVFFLLAFSSLCFSLFSGLLAKLYEPVHKENFLYRFNFIYGIADLIVLILSILIFKDLFSIAVTVTVFRLIVLYLFSVNVKLNAPDFYPWWKEGSIKEELINFKKSLFLLFSNFIERFQHDGLVLYVSHFLGESVVVLFSTTKIIGNSATGGVASIINPTLPETQANFAQKKLKKALDIIFININISSFVISSFFIFLSPYVEELFIIWTKHKLNFDSGFYYYMVATAILFNFGYNFLSIIRAFNYTKKTFIIVVVKVSLLFLIPLFLKRDLETIGISMMYSEIGGLLIALLFFISLFPVRYLNKILKLLILSFIPSLFAIYAVYSILFSEGNLIVMVLIYLVLFAINIFFNGKSIVVNLIKSK